jgi:hypothetical protein
VKVNDENSRIRIRAHTKTSWISNTALFPLGVLFTFLVNSCYLMSTAPSNEFLPESARCHTMDIVSRLTSIACSPYRLQIKKKYPRESERSRRKVAFVVAII